MRRVPALLVAACAALAAGCTGGSTEGGAQPAASVPVAPASISAAPSPGATPGSPTADPASPTAAAADAGEQRVGSLAFRVTPQWKGVELKD